MSYTIDASSLNANRTMQNKTTKLYMDGRRATGDLMEKVLRESRGNKQPAQISGRSRQDLF